MRKKKRAKEAKAKVELSEELSRTTPRLGGPSGGLGDQAEEDEAEKLAKVPPEVLWEATVKMVHFISERE